MLTLGTKIRKLRELRGYKQEHMAEKLGISQAAYSKIERDEVEISDERLEQVAKTLGVSVQDILTFDEKKVFNVMHNETVQNANFDSVGEINFNEASDEVKALYEDKIKLLQDKIQMQEEIIVMLKQENERLKSGKA